MTNRERPPEIRLMLGDCLEVMRGLPSDSIDAVVCDPPAGIAFMNKSWDKPGTLGVSGGNASPMTLDSRNPMCRQCHKHKRGGKKYEACACEHPDFDEAEAKVKHRTAFVDFLRSRMTEALRLTKPGGHALVWALPRTSHWTATALEDAGWDIREIITHIFGSGFPKSLDVSKAIDKAAGIKREVVGSQYVSRRLSPDDLREHNFSVGTQGHDAYVDVTAPATDAAKQWSGWGTALKPASEHWILCRKPLIGSVAKNVLAHGVGGLNIDACRTGGEWEKNTPTRNNIRGGQFIHGDSGGDQCGPQQSHSLGRWPTNFVLSHVGGPDGCKPVGTKQVKSDGHFPEARTPHIEGGAIYGSGYGLPVETAHGESYMGDQGMETVPAWACVPGCPVAELDRQSGEQISRSSLRGLMQRHDAGDQSNARPKEGTSTIRGHDDSGGASRFFPTFAFEADDFVPFVYEGKAAKVDRNEGCEQMPKTPCGMMEDDAYPIKTGSGNLWDTQRRNHHPTVKSTNLMRFLVKLICPPGGTILDPFLGSGSTLKAAMLEGFGGIGIEVDPEYFKIAQARVKVVELPLFPNIAEPTP